MGTELRTPHPSRTGQLEAGDAYFIGGPWAEQTRRLDERPEHLDVDDGVYDRGPDTPRGAAVYHWRWQPPRRAKKEHSE